MPIQPIRTSSEFARGEQSTERLRVNINDTTNAAQGVQEEVILPIRHNRRLARESIWRVLSLDELRLILRISAAEPNLRDLHDILTIILNTGIRPGELREFQWADIDSQRRRFVVGKNSKSGYARYVPFGPRTYQMLEARREREPETEYVFGALSRALLARCSHQLRTLSETIGVGHICLSTLRNNFFVRWIKSRKSLDALCLISGQKLCRIDVHLSWEHRLAIAARGQAQLEEEL
jgi:integrase